MQAEAGTGASRRFTMGQPGVEQFIMKVPNNKAGKNNLRLFLVVLAVHDPFFFLTLNLDCYDGSFFFLSQVGLIIGKGGEMIKSMQAKSGARIQVRLDTGSVWKSFFLLFLRYLCICACNIDKLVIYCACLFF